MPVPARFLGALLLAAATLGLAACESAEERAERHHRRGLELVAAGDFDRAAVEFRNVFRLDPGHSAARLAFARVLRDRGDVAGAIEQYALLVDTDRDNLEGHRELAELALTAQDFETAAESVRRAFELAPEDPTVRAFKATLDYRAGEDRPAALAMAEGVLAADPASVPAHMVLIADRMNAGDPAGALVRVETALAAAPGDEGLHLVRLAALERLGDDAAVGEQIARMAALFPDNAGIAEAQMRWHMRRGDAAGAEAVLRGLAAREPGASGPALTVVRFLYETAGPEAARAELDRLIAAAADPLPFRRARAGLDFTEGRVEEAIAALSALLEDVEPGAEPDDETRDMEVELAAMRDAAGDAAGRDALIAAVLAADPDHVGALKLRARARIAADAPDLAIQDMRAALAQAPRDPEVMTIMALAHEREGARELAGERLALAVEASDRAPAESLRYARFLLRDGRVEPAEGVLVDALRRSPDDPDLLAALGGIHVGRRDWPRAAETAALLRRGGDPEAARMAAEIELASLSAQNRGEESLALLRELAEGGGAGSGDGDAAALARLMQGYLAAGDLAAAQSHLDGLLAADPEGLPGRMMLAGLRAAQGAPAEAEAIHRELIAENPAAPEPHRGLFALLAGQGRLDEAAAALEAGLAATGGDADLLFLQAGLRERRGDFEGAIAAYEALYARDSANPLVANNLASLLASHRDDPASLERAFAVARRLRGSDVPHFQDTYGWILHRRGDSEGAIAFLEPAARALGDNALVQHHLAEAELALGRREAALEGFKRAVAAAEASAEAEPPQIAAARARILEIEAAPAPDPAPAEAAAAETDG